MIFATTAHSPAFDDVQILWLEVAVILTVFGRRRLDRWGLVLVDGGRLSGSNHPISLVVLDDHEAVDPEKLLANTLRSVNSVLKRMILSITRTPTTSLTLERISEAIGRSSHIVSLKENVFGFLDGSRDICGVSKSILDQKLVLK